uniref:Uncharacterized protein n=1 Tax=Anguilla anguilla TaxID=7936 RepID=A0A0E9VCM8_ANGAN
MCMQEAMVVLLQFETELFAVTTSDAHSASVKLMLHNSEIIQHLSGSYLYEIICFSTKSLDHKICNKTPG